MIKKSKKIGDVFPDQGILQEGGGDWAGITSILQMEIIMGNKNFCLGDSGVMIEIDEDIKQGAEGLEQMKRLTLELAPILKEAIPAMSEEYRQYFQSSLDDFDKNGLVMPYVGKLL